LAHGTANAGDNVQLASDLRVNGPPSSGGGAVPGAAATLYKLQGAGPPTDGVTGAGVVDIGEKYFDTTNKNEYTNVGTLAAPLYSGTIRA
jgi:hypothetical protein